jgi:hypothetical protein
VLLGLVGAALLISAEPLKAEVPGDAVWSLVTDTPAFGPRDCAGSLVFNGRMWLLGGWYPYDDPTTNSEVWSSPDGLDWQLETVAPWEGRHCAGYAVHRGKMWIVGGDNNRYHYQNDVWSSPDGIDWTLVAGDVPWRDRVTHHVLAFDDRLWVLGGQQITYFDPSGGDAVYNDVWSSPDGVDWTRVLERAPWAPRGQILGAAVFKGRMWILGGGTYNDPRRYYRDVWSSADGVAWDRVGRAPWAPREYHNVAVFDGRLWVLGGYRNGNLDDVWSSPDGVHWRQALSMLPPGLLVQTPWGARHAGNVFVFDGALWMVGGSILDSTPVADVWRLDLVAPLDCAPLPRTSCAVADAPRGSSLDLKDGTLDSRDSVTWRWRGGASWVGNPQLDTALALCLYQTGASPVLLGGALPGGLCSGRPCWEGAPGGFRYLDSQTYAAGTKRVRLTARGSRTNVSLHGGGSLVRMPALAAITTPFRVQMQGSHGVCWEAQFSDEGVRQRTATRFVATSD